MRNDLDEDFLVRIFVLSNFVSPDDLDLATLINYMFGRIETFIDILLVSEFDVAMAID